MKNPLKNDLFLLFTAMVVSGVVASYAIKEVERRTYVPAEFVCYTMGKLTERHVGVVAATFLATGSVKIRYAEGNSVYYMPKSGESCAVEEVR